MTVQELKNKLDELIAQGMGEYTVYREDDCRSFVVNHVDVRDDNAIELQ